MENRLAMIGAIAMIGACAETPTSPESGDVGIADEVPMPTAQVVLKTPGAERYNETNILGVSGPLGLGRGMYKITASGELEDGRSFRLKVNEVLGELQQVRIEFRP